MKARAIMFATAGVLALGGCQEETEAPVPVRPVLFTTVEPQKAETFGPFASSVEARYQSQFGFQVAGRMVARDVYVGQTVRAGQRLAALDPTTVQFALTRAKADVADATAQFANAAGIEQRQRALASNGSATKAILDNAVAGRDTARARLDQTRAALRAATDQLGYTQLHATFDGVVSAWSAEIGQYVANGQAVVTIARPDVREVALDIPDALIGQVAVGTTFSVRLQAAPNTAVRGKVREIGPLADAATRTHRVRLTLIDPPPTFRLGTTISAAVERPGGLHVQVPASAILEQDGRTFVWLIASDAKFVLRREVRVAGRREDEVTLSSGLGKGDRIVTAGVHSLTDHQRVTVRSEMPDA